MKKIIKILTFILILIPAIFINVQARTIYVDKMRGSNINEGSESAPYRTIQKGVDNASAGDTVIVKKAVYYESVHIKNKGTQENPITIKAEEGTVVSGADEPLRKNIGKNLWSLEDEELGLYSADLALDTGDTELVNPTKETLFPARVLADDMDLLQYPSLDALKKFVLNDNELYYLEGFSYGYYYDAINKKIYVRLKCGENGEMQNPNECVMKISPTYYTATGLGSMRYGHAVGYGSYNMLVGEKLTMSSPLAEIKTRMPSYYVIIDGFTFETPGLTGVFLRASDVTVKNCRFSGCRIGVKGATRVVYDMAYSDNVTVENCEYTQYPTFDEAQDFIAQVKKGTKKAIDRTTGNVMKYYWWHKKSEGVETYGINADLRYETGGITGNIGENWVIRGNLISNVFDGFSTGAMTKYYEKKIYNGQVYTVNVGAENISIYNNKFIRCLDNCIEVEEHGKNISIYNNEFLDSYLPLSWQPTKGPDYPTNIYIYNNLIYNTPEFGKFWSQTAQHATFAFKIGVQTTNWTFPWSDSMPQEGERAKVVLAEEGFNVYNNTVIIPYGYPIAFVNSNRDNWAQFNPLFVNMRLKNNVFVSHVKKIPDKVSGYLWDGVTADTVGGIGNCVLSNTGIEYSDNIFAPDMNDGYVSTQLTSNGGVCLKNIEELKLNALTMRRYDVGAQEDSPLFNITVSDKKYGDYIGAVGKGKSYSSPVCGVQKE